MKRVIIALVLGLIGLACSGNNQDEAAGRLDPELQARLAGYINHSHMPPVEYVVSKFDDHDIVFVGERHRIKHDVQLIHELIPALYQNGIYNLGIEFAIFQDQELIDSLITAEEYDESLARQIQFDQWPYWGFQDYIDIYRVAWDLNHSLPEDARKFRVVGLNGRSDWSHVWTDEDRRNPEVMKKVWPYGDSDKHMAKIIFQEFVDKGEKALIYSGMNHAYTRYRQPYESDSGWAYNNSRMGNRVYDSIGNRCMTIFLHNPWPAKDDYGRETYPVDTIIDRLMCALPDDVKPVGFDVVGTPFENLPGKSSYWSNGYDNFTLGMYCDGYVYQKPFWEYEGVSVAEGFINEENRKAAAAQSANPRTKDSTESVEDLMASMRNDTEIQRIFGFYGLDEPLPACRQE
jgi:hypothetical protein